MNTRHARRLVAFLLPLCLAAGCNLFRPKPEAPEARAPAAGPVDTSTLNAETMVGFLNKQADLVQSLEADDISLTAKAQGNRPPSLDGSLMIQSPRYFRLVGKFLGSQEVLVGSNKERFWFYVKRDPSDALFHCSYTDFDKGGVDLPFPFDPEWVLEAMGMAHIAPDQPRKIEKDEKANVVRLIQDGTLQGKKVKKVTVCYLPRTRGNVPQVKSRTVYDEHGRVICTATIKSVTRYPVGKSREGEMVYAIVPQVVKLEWPAQDTTLELDLGRVKINGQLPMEAFQMPHLGSRQVDLGRDHPTGRGVVPAQFR